MTSIVISSGHGKYIRGASCPPPGLDEVDEARKIVERVAEMLRGAGVEVVTYHDDVSTSQNENLNRIVDFHNSQTRTLDVSVHLNAYETTDKPMGTECLYVTQDQLAADVSAAIAQAGGLIDRGGKYRDDLFFLGNTEEKAILIETVFCDSYVDADLYRQNFDPICEAIAETIGNVAIDAPAPPERPGRPERPVRPDEENRVAILGTAHGDVQLIVNGAPIEGATRCPNIVRLAIAAHGDVTVTVNGEDFHNRDNQVE